ncbi:hypothetical protein ILUMI_13051 [Ignelater luminosus]|uniref:F-box domain-containing protein n=1 Tax=Ignelater luminosus TaxID=2038154 RepID=A0A8K0CT47_IGNLU|nr:hypothetical protein ILUMI_13051 [Ignelater luminosus]
MATKSHINNLPDEVLVKVFELLPKRDILSSVTLVCTRWNNLSKDRVIWDSIYVNETASMQDVYDWIAVAPKLKYFTAENRNDADRILVRLSKQCKELKSLRILNCWGSHVNWTVHSEPLCNIVTRCKSLENIHFHNIKFNSCKFFELLAKTVNNKRQRKLKRVTYLGPITSKQFSTYLRASRKYECDNSASFGKVNKMFNLSDILRVLDNRPGINIDAFVAEIWRNLDNNGNADPNVLLNELKNRF